MNAGYVRLSRDDDKKNYVSIENQKLIISQYANDHGVKIDRWYEDDGISGYIFDRPGFQQMMADLDQEIDTVYVKDFSRLGRHNAKVLLLLDEFQERGNSYTADNVIRSTEAIGERIQRLAESMEQTAVANPKTVEIVRNTKIEENIRRISMSDMERNYEDVLNRNKARKKAALDRQKEFTDKFKKKMLDRAYEKQA